jgi:hypothetical protein
MARVPEIAELGARVGDEKHPPRNRALLLTPTPSRRAEQCPRGFTKPSAGDDACRQSNFRARARVSGAEVASGAVGGHRSGWRRRNADCRSPPGGRRRVRGGPYSDLHWLTTSDVLQATSAAPCARVAARAGQARESSLLATAYRPRAHSARCCARGDDRNRTGVDGFAGRCVATPPRRRGRQG